MLERSRLLVRNWTQPGDGPPRRPILDADTGEPAGFARWQPAESPWWRRLGPAALEVRETEDESLLFVLRRCWGLGTSWEVRDADGRPVAVVRRGWVEDRRESLAALIERDRAVWRFRGSRGEDLGCVEPGADGVAVTFAPGAGENPFLRMAVLAAALRW
jgi:hypothetical protein